MPLEAADYLNKMGKPLVFSDDEIHEREQVFFVDIGACIFFWKDNKEGAY